MKPVTPGKPKFWQRWERSRTLLVAGAGILMGMLGIGLAGSCRASTQNLSIHFLPPTP
ncbi:hypothetical protein [Ralstonia sp.]|uniref:hypothetical protein n=1 Tax=Ralstonia sp. TaxID=54061 RepID=UPI00257AC7AC|nr:hypothetical protein [Ralstonia sp.]